MGVGARIGTLLAVAAAMACRGAPPPRSAIQPALPRIPRDAPRFEIDSITDSTATFRIQEARWIRRGMASYAVDPQQRDALVARLRIIARDSLTGTALITSQVARVRPDHFLLVIRPAVPWYRSRVFWAGAVSGISTGAIAAVLILR